MEQYASGDVEMMFSIIIPTLNEERYLPRLLGSIRNQRFRDYEIIVADAHSKDKTRDIARRFGCRIVNGGISSLGRNNGAKIAKGEYFLFLDADGMIADKRFLEKLVDVINRRNVEVGSCLALPIHGSILDKILHISANAYMRIAQWTKPLVWGPCMFSSKQLFDKVKGFNQNLRFGEDLDFGYRAAKHGKYRAIPIYFGVSLRKFKKDGYLRTISNYINIGIRYSLFTKVGQNRVKYRFYSEKK